MSPAGPCTRQCRTTRRGGETSRAYSRTRRSVILLLRSWCVAPYKTVLTRQATYGLYFISSLIYLEPWHMFTSFFQYLLLLPSYVNILLIYAFCNLHDVSWGTKGDNGSAKDLGQVKVTTKNGEKVAEVKATRQEDIEDLYRQAKAELHIPMEHVKEKRSQETKRADADRNFRTHVVLWFLGVNMIIILVLTSHTVTEWLNTKFNPNPEETNFNPYLVSGAEPPSRCEPLRARREAAMRGGDERWRGTVSRLGGPAKLCEAGYVADPRRNSSSGPSSPSPRRASRAVSSISSSGIWVYRCFRTYIPASLAPASVWGAHV